MTNSLNEHEVNIIKNLAKEKLGLCRKGNDIIGTQIFSILSLYARVIYYPLGKDAPWGFTRLIGTKNDVTTGKPFVAINSSIPVDCQVFAAAHELYHIWFEQKPDVLPSDLLEEQGKECEERKANRFAAEFLVDEVLLKQEIETYGIEKFTIKNILWLANLFTVPYRTMVKRLREIGVINVSEESKFLSESEDSVEKYKKRYSISTVQSHEHIVIDNLVELAVMAYEAGYITFEKLEYLLEMSGLKPEELGIEDKPASVFPTDEELDCLMEEDV